MNDFDITYELPCKRYVKRYLELHYGTPALLIADDLIGRYFYQLADDGSMERDSRISLGKYKHTVTLRITKRIFFRRGHILTHTNVVAFNCFVENKIKEDCKYFILGSVRMGRVMRSKAYLAFLEETGLTEDDLPVETMKKHVDRRKVFLNTRKSA